MDNYSLPTPNLSLLVKFPLFYGCFDKILRNLVVPFIIEGLPVPDNGLEGQLKLIIAGFAEVPVRKMKAIAPRLGLLNRMPAYIADKGLHLKLLNNVFDKRNS
jgi:hypothetical protein